MTTGSVTAMLDRLEKLDYAERHPDPGDRRRVMVRPSQQSLALTSKIYGPLAEERRPRFRPL